MAQEFLASECRCSCRNALERDACLAKQWYWNPDLCTCMCPNRPYPTCPTSYIFDHVQTCSCLSVAYTARTVLELVLVVVSLGTLCTVASLFQCYRKGLGLFKHRRGVRYRSDSFKSKVRSLSEVLDRRRRRESTPQGEELAMLNSNTSNQKSHVNSPQPETDS